MKRNETKQNGKNSETKQKKNSRAKKRNERNETKETKKFEKRNETKNKITCFKPCKIVIKGIEIYRIIKIKTIIKIMKMNKHNFLNKALNMNMNIMGPTSFFMTYLKGRKIKNIIIIIKSIKLYYQLNLRYKKKVEDAAK
jgi:ABC-type antimicrobial peptide transport system permease subunit